MMRFNLEAGYDAVIHLGEPVIECALDLITDRERFFIPVSFWTRDKYIFHWLQSFRSGLKTQTHSALITSMREPLMMNFVFLWVLFYEGDEVILQNKVLFLDEINGEFHPEKINEYVGDRQQFNEEGQRISEWVVPLNEVVNCFEKMS